VSVIWHDLECGRYTEDLGLWRELALEHAEPILDVGAGTGRIALDLARRGHRVTAVDLDLVLLAELERRAAGLPLRTVRADARELDLDERFGLCIVPMQTIQLLGGARGRRDFLAAARRNLMPTGVLAIAISEELETFEVPEGARGPVPDICELDGVVYSSLPTAVRADGDGFVLERRREIVTGAGDRSVEEDRIRLDRVSPETLELEATEAGFRPHRRLDVPATRDYAGSMVVTFRA
jgi:SAM-dependent methyltransferase